VSTKADFNAEEWTAVTAAPTLAAMYVSAAERGGGISESLAAARAYGSARAQAASALLKDVLSSPPAINRTAAQQTIKEAPAKLREAIRTLERHAGDEEVNEYKRFVYAVAEAVAQAHREGGFLGLGGQQVSEAEQAALDEIGAIFDAPRSESVTGPAPRHNFTEDEARDLGATIGIDWDSASFDVDQFRRGLKVELEHGRRDPQTNVTDDDPVTTAKIALAHLKELPDYYDRLAVMEGEEPA
jgi:hypothetical protein